MVEAILERLSEENHVKVQRVVLQVGKLTALLPESMRFCFDMCVSGTILEGARLEIIETLGVATCRKCGGRVESSQPYAFCKCGSAELDWISGQELKIKELEVRRCA
jgi:hydrogenase nickel incorporation protein HypA/HybF